MTALDPTTVTKIESQLHDNPILLYMKGTPAQPQCGFSAKAVQALQACKAQFASVNVLEELDIRQALPVYANWPTFPQLYLKGELIGGCDIVLDLLQSGELQQLVNQAMQKA